MPAATLRAPLLGRVSEATDGKPSPGMPVEKEGGLQVFEVESAEAFHCMGPGKDLQRGVVSGDTTLQSRSVAFQDA